MTSTMDAFEAVVGLAFGGFLFLTLGSAVTSSMSGSPFIDFQFWGIIYIIAAIVIAVVTAYAAALSILN